MPSGITSAWLLPCWAKISSAPSARAASGSEYAGSGSISAQMASAASSAWAWVSANTAAMGSPTKRTRSVASGGRAKSGCTATKPWWAGTSSSAAVHTAMTPGMARASSTWMAVTVPWATWDLAKDTNAVPSNPRSAT